jgi:hypothetical protein
MFAGNYEAVPLVTFIEWLGKWIVESLMKIMIAESSLSTFFIQPYWLLRKQDLDFFCFFFFLFHVSMQAKKKLILQNFKMKNKQRKFLIPSIKHKTEPVIIPSTTSLEFFNSSNDS